MKQADWCTSPEEAEVRRWLAKAEHDRSAARRLLTPQCTEFDVIAFHCQQAVEKMLKAYLVSRSRSFQKTHDLGLLLDYTAGIDPALGELRPIVEPLSIYAVAFRYPGPAEPLREEVEEALRAVEQVRAALTSRVTGWPEQR